MKYTHLATGLALACLNPLSFAEDLSELDFLSETPLVISSATRLSQRLVDVPASVTVIDRAMIEVSSATNLIELLRLVPGFQVGSIDGTESTATYHGLSTQHNKRLQILIDGRSVYQSTFGGALWYSLPISIKEIEKIEVLRGPNAASFGANAFSAVVNITTLHSSAEPGLKIGHLGGERDTNRNHASYAKKLDRTSFRINAELESNSGYQNSYKDSHNLVGEPVLPVRTDYPLYDDHFHRQLNLRIDHETDTGVNHTLEFGFKNLKFGDGYIDTLNDGQFDEVSAFDKDVDVYYFNYLWEKSSSLLLTNRLRASYHFIDQDEPWFGNVGAGDLGFGHPFLPNSYTRETSFQDMRLDLEFQQNRILSPTLQTVWGAGFRYDETNSPGYLLNDKHSRYSFNTFAHLEWQQKDWLTWNIGGFVENHENIGTYFSPRLAVNLKPSNSHSFRANVSRAYRMPSFEAQYANQYTVVTTNLLVGAPAFLNPGDQYNLDLYGNDQLDPEEMTSFEIGYRGHFFMNKLDIDIRLAKEKIENLIEAAKTNTGDNNTAIPQFRWLNYGEVEIDSAELQVSYKPTDNNLLRLIASYANVYGNKANIYTDYDGDTSLCTILLGNPPPLNDYSCADEGFGSSTPLLTTGVLVSHRFDSGLLVSSQYSFHEAYRTSGDGDQLNTPFETLDIKVARQWVFNQNSLKASAIIKNVADEYYEDFENDNLVGREVYFQIELGLN